ncbi:hypothetical protein FB45DRAFT_69652 [Roridomyces roridus]|uniref:Fungal calcium binding protein domain-containing protein n=1 Tax=Roridomyces roridus TaxID=1738132 RepID=A0AAD7FKP4_9AGAR|nr:hypothetical protein FB45DRAFT_69652 [Roridomyces roridus]
MQFSLLALVALAAAVSAAPSRRQSQCDLKNCVLDLAPTVVTCAAAAAQVELDPISDISCLIAAATAVEQLPTPCNGCLAKLESFF